MCVERPAFFRLGSASTRMQLALAQSPGWSARLSCGKLGAVVVRDGVLTPEGFHLRAGTEGRAMPAYNGREEHAQGRAPRAELPHQPPMAPRLGSTSRAARTGLGSPLGRGDHEASRNWHS